MYSATDYFNFELPLLTFQVGAAFNLKISYWLMIALTSKKLPSFFKQKQTKTFSQNCMKALTAAIVLVEDHTNHPKTGTRPQNPPLPSTFGSYIPRLISGRVDKASVTETVDSGSIPDRVKSKTIKIGIHSFPAGLSTIKKKCEASTVCDRQEDTATCGNLT